MIRPSTVADSFAGSSGLSCAPLRWNYGLRAFYGTSTLGITACQMDIKIVVYDTSYGGNKLCDGVASAISPEHLKRDVKTYTQLLQGF
jgi:hypothetical protein